MKTIQGDDGRARCAWCEAADFPLYRHYHDTEWGYPVADETRLFEKLCLEGFQSGLSWRTILTKREAFRVAFAGFDVARVAAFDEADIQRLLKDSGIVRHRGKIEATIGNAQALVALHNSGRSLAAMVWDHEEAPALPIVRSESAASQALSKQLKKVGFRFVGPTTCYAFMQAMGLVNDHAPDCWAREPAMRARAAFQVPT
ncbi:DNA-3-methyladenine glycosylase I [Inhella gelatinilytica]|uniref:DNA-3-methyladenine glycosylase I n=1 Tax=Inhella gelatinilytica TaxID=2795030 RepID=A0A931J127_9BURK|nr:DNA-3-methyladenine glycosylase I [Inhella gelatinilytica]MBH9553568.1 DNA-3-methyladenine glycosylase I [Inhella gelatinilytica]